MRLVWFGVVGLSVACDMNAHVPKVNGCPRVEVEAYTAGENECLRLRDSNGLTLFRLDDSKSCGGPPCLRLEPGQTAYALEKIKPGPEAEWTVERGACEEVASCDP